MRVTEIAGLAGTTPRAVRHYHRLGLLDVPPTVGGRRDYGVEHLARLLRIRWLADGGLTLRQVAAIVAADDLDGSGAAVADSADRPSQDQAPVPAAPPGAHRRRVLRDLHATRAGIEARRRSLDEQTARIDELIAQVESGHALAPVPVAVLRFYDAVEARIRAVGGDLGSLTTERQVTLILGSLGMVPASCTRFLEALDDDDINLIAEQLIAFGDLARAHERAPDRLARQLARRTYGLALRHKPLVQNVLDDLPGGTMGRAIWHVAKVLLATGYPHPAQRAFIDHLLTLLLADPDLSPSIRRSAGKDPLL